MTGALAATTLLAMGCSWGGGSDARAVSPTQFIQEPSSAQPGVAEAPNLPPVEPGAPSQGVAEVIRGTAERLAESVAPPAANPRPPVPLARPALAATDEAVAGAGPAEPVIVSTPPAQTLGNYTVDAMVGQVNGQAIYASRVLGPIDEVLQRMASENPRPIFRTKSAELIGMVLQRIVYDALIIGEAERELSPQEQQGLRYYMQKQREQLLRKWGQGSTVVADVALREQTGKGLEATLDETRQRALVERYTSQKVMPKLNVTWRDIERYYTLNKAEFNPPPGRVLRFIWVEKDNVRGVDRIKAALAAGKPFAEVAGDRANLYRRDDGGLMPEAQVGDKVTRFDAINAAIVSLKPGEHSDRIEVDGESWWVFVESVSTGEARSIVDAQKDIEDRLRRQRFQATQDRYRKQLFATGSYNPLDDMTRSLVDIAMSRYAPAN